MFVELTNLNGHKRLININCVRMIEPTMGSACTLLELEGSDNFVARESYVTVRNLMTEQVMLTPQELHSIRENRRKEIFPCGTTDAELSS